MESSDGGPSKSSGSNPEKNDCIPADGGEQLSGDEGDGDWLVDGAGNRSPKARRKRGPSAKVVGAMEDWKLIGERGVFFIYVPTHSFFLFSSLYSEKLVASYTAIEVLCSRILQTAL